MRLGVAFWHGISPERVDRTLERLEGIGVRGLGHIAVQGWSDAEIRQCARKFEARGMFVGEVTLYQCGWPLAGTDSAQRREAVATLAKGFEDAAALAARCVGVSVIADGPGDGDLWSEDLWKRLVSGAAEAAAEAERIGVDMAFHPGNRGPLDAPEQLRGILDEVASPRLKVILDPVNMTDHRNYHDNTGFLNRCFDLLGDDIVAAHAKDVHFDYRHLITKLDEVPLGMGGMDYETYLRRLDQLDPGVVLTIEHYRDVGVSGTVASPVYVSYPEGDRENRRAREFVEEAALRVGARIN